MVKNDTTQSLQIGYIPSGNISVVLYQWQYLFLQYAFVVIACVDSHDEPAEFKDVERCFLQAGCVVEKLVGRFVIPNGKATLNTIMETFTGFDEIWFFDKKPISGLGPCLMPQGISVTDKTDPYHTEIVADIRTWMSWSDCRIVLGDGAGLNYASTDPLVSAAFEQRPDHQKIE